MVPGAVRGSGFLALVTWALLSVDVSPQTRERLESFYVTASHSTIVHVEPVGTGVKVRVIHVEAHDEFCWTRVVRSYDVVLPNMTVEALAGTAVCALSERRVERAVARAREKFVRPRDGLPDTTFFGDVRLRLDVDRVSGAVTEATVVERHALLKDAALAAGRQWRFVTPSIHSR